GKSDAASTSAATPGMPKTLASSCGSAATAVVPHGSTLRTNSSTHSFVDSRCMWESMNAGVSAAPPTSTTSTASRGPQPTTTPSQTARRGGGGASGSGGARHEAILARQGLDAFELDDRDHGEDQDEQ